MHNSDKSVELSDSHGGSQTVDRALTMLMLLATRGPSGVTELGNELGVHKSTASRLMTTLEKYRFVEQEGNRGKYRLGFGIVRLAGATAAQLDIASESRDICRRLAAQLHGRVCVSVLEGEAVTVVLQEPSTERNWIGLRAPLHATASGKILLASFGFEELGEALERPRQRFTSATVTGPGALLAELNRARDRGWAAASGELEVGLNAVAVPIRRPGGRIAGALSLTASPEDLRAVDFADIARLLTTAVEEILDRLQTLAGF